MSNLIKSLYFKLVVTLFLCLGILVSSYTWYQCRQVRTRVEKDLEVKGLGFAKAAALGLQAMIENDIQNGIITKEQLFDRNYKLVTDHPEPKNRKYSSAFDHYTDKHWQKYVDSFLVDEDVVFSIPVAYSNNPALNGYLPTHNSIFKDRSKRIFNDETGAAAAASNNTNGLKQVYRRDTGEVMWDMSYPICLGGQHWGGYRVAISIKAAEAKIAAVQKGTIIIMVAILFLICVILLIVSRVIIGIPLKRILKAAENLGSGDADLTHRLEIRSNDELGVLAGFFNSFLDKIHQTVKKIAQSIDSVTQTNDQFANNTEGAAKAGQNHFNQASMTIGQMASAIQDVATGAESVLEASVEASNVACKGEEAVESTISGMERIKKTVYESAVKIKDLGEHSQKIGEIIQVIDEIAEQTNLLALNAAIEAARAGDHGKGFAVVADEVRKLAERSGKATKEIAELISNIQKGTEKAVEAMEQGTQEVEEGVQLAHDAGTALEEIMKTVEQTHSQIKLISSSTEDIAQAAENLSMMTYELRTLVGGFKI